MKKRNPTNKDIMDRLDELEKRNTTMSAIFLLYSLAIAFLIAHFSSEGYLSTFSLFFGGIFYLLGIIITVWKKLIKPDKKRRD